MAEDSGISWTDNTFNPWMGCTKVSPACKNCYAERDMDHRYKRVSWGNGGTRVVTSDAYWKQPVKWNREAEAQQQWYATHRMVDAPRRRVFCASLADVFELWTGPITNHHGERVFWSHSREPHQSKWHWIGEKDCAGDEKPVTMDDVRARLFEMIDQTPNLDWLLLTKRPENIEQMWVRKVEQPSEEWCNQHLDNAGRHRLTFRHNVWLGTTVENQDYARDRILPLLKCRDLAAILFVSAEPLLGPLDLRSVRIGAEFDETGLPWFDCLSGTAFSCDDVGHGYPAIDWVIVGSESGPNKRPSSTEWFRDIRDQCKNAGTAFFMKQMDVSGYLIKEIADFPSDLAFQEFPNAN